MEFKALQNEKLMKWQDDINQSVELNKKVSNLIIDSIQAKIFLLKKMKWNNKILINYFILINIYFYYRFHNIIYKLLYWN